MQAPWEFEDPSCLGIDTEIFFPVEADYPPNLPLIRSMCFSCNERAKCLEWAVHNERFGIWAGTTENQRKAIRRQRNIKVGDNIA